jgi:predicted glycosyltransferase
MSRFLFYSHDSTGLGHLRRTFALARALADDPDTTSLILSGSPVAPSYALPARVETVKLPSLAKEEDGTYHSLRLDIPLEDVQSLRGHLALGAAVAYRPDVLVVDKTPLGLHGELVPTLDHLRETNCKLVLGLRDIDDSPDNVRREWRGHQLRRLIRHYYDTILVYGPASSPDALDILGWNDLGMPIHHVGYVGQPIPTDIPRDMPRDYLLVTPGGGADGFRVLATVADAIRQAPLPLATVMVTGPLMGRGAVEQLVSQTRDLDIVVEDFRTDMAAVIAGARAVVAMAGYNTVAELMMARKPALLVPRVRPREEQLVRATALAGAGLCAMLHPDDMTPAVMRQALDQLLRRARPSVPAGEHDGAGCASGILSELADASIGESARQPVAMTSGAYA